MTGPNGVGKTNLLEAIHVGSQGFSPRTRSDAEIIRFGRQAARVALRGERRGAALDLELLLALQRGKRARLNGAALTAAEQLRHEVSVLVFTPDRLVIVKGAPAARRSYFDRALGRLAPARATLPVEYAAAIGQRNASLRRVAAGLASRDSLEPWTQRVAELGAELMEARRGVVSALAPGFRRHGEALGLPAAELRYEGEAATANALEARLERDLDKGTTGLGPHLHDIGILVAERDLRRFGSQGEQRLAVLALLLAEAELVNDGGDQALLLLDDVLSELDDSRREVLVERARELGQCLVTATSRSALPGAPDQLVEVEPGRARAA